MQATINFNTIVHIRENKRSNEIILNGCRQRLAGQCKLVYELMQQGKRLTVRDAMINYGIGDLRRRCADLREAGIMVKSELKEKRFKEYYL